MMKLHDVEGDRDVGHGEAHHNVDLLAIYMYASSTLLLSGVFRRVVVDGESFMDAVFAAAGQG